MDASDTACESGPGSLFDQAGLDRLAAHQGGQVAKRWGDIDAGDRGVRCGLRTAFGEREGIGYNTRIKGRRTGDHRRARMVIANGCPQSKADRAGGADAQISPEPAPRSCDA